MKLSDPILPGRAKWRRAKPPFIEQHFQPGDGEPFGRAMYGWNPGDPSRKRSLYRMSGEYFQREMHREFFLEAVAFTIIVLISAWPLTAMVLMLMRLIK